VKRSTLDSIEVTISGVGIPGGSPSDFDVRMSAEYDNDFTLFNYHESDSVAPSAPLPTGALWHGVVKLLGASSTLVVREYESHPIFEGATGASPLRITKKLVYATAVDIGPF
jgi:hypothetical protein